MPMWKWYLSQRSMEKAIYPFSPEPLIVVHTWSKYGARGSFRKCDKDLSRLMTKPTNWHMHPAKTQISLGIHPVWSESSLCTQWVAKDPSFLHVDSEDLSNWADAQADLSLCWAHLPSDFLDFVGFVIRRLNFSSTEEVNDYKNRKMLRSPFLLHAYSDDWSDCLDAHADPSLCRVHRSFCWLCQALAHFKNICLFVLRLNVPVNNFSVMSGWIFKNITADQKQMSRSMTKPTKSPVRPAKTQISLGICPVWLVFAVCMKKP